VFFLAVLLSLLIVCASRINGFPSTLIEDLRVCHDRPLNSPAFESTVLYGERRVVNLFAEVDEVMNEIHKAEASI
jgi:hypothetical protein